MKKSRSYLVFPITLTERAHRLKKKKKKSQRLKKITPKKMFKLCCETNDFVKTEMVLF